MKSMGTYLLGYILMLGGLVAGVWKLVVERSGAAWMGIVIVIVTHCNHALGREQR